jgi:hypothetical protein
MGIKERHVSKVPPAFLSDEVLIFEKKKKKKKKKGVVF